MAQAKRPKKERGTRQEIRRIFQHLRNIDRNLSKIIDINRQILGTRTN